MCRKLFAHHRTANFIFVFGRICVELTNSDGLLSNANGE